MVRKIRFVPRSHVSDDGLARNRQNSDRLNLPSIGEAGPVAPKLAVVGGGPSVSDYLSELKDWHGEIWAANGAFLWCLSHGIDATFYTLDPSPDLAQYVTQAKRAILSSACDPSLFEAIQGPIETFPVGELPSGTSSVATAPMVAARRGHQSVTFFGCESSFHEREHAYEWPMKTDSRVLVECGGSEYLTTPQLIMQAEYMAEIAREIPSFISVRGEGFLPALIEHGDYSVSKVSRNVMEGLSFGNLDV